jgi:ATP-dependent DNA ligase
LFSAEFAPMEARLVAELPAAGAWQFEPKWDGFRCLALREGQRVELRGRSGKALGRFLPEVVRAFLGLKVRRLVLDGELLIPVGGSLSFDALQMRLHPALSRIEKLSRETPALFMAFDLLAWGASDYFGKPLAIRRAALESFFAKERPAAGLRLSPATRDLEAARAWLARAGSGALDGVIAKPDGPYHPGERAMLKIKCLRTADCVVAGFRYATERREVGSLLLGLFNEEGLLDHVGFTSGISDRERPALTRRLERLRGGAGFTGKAPGAPSRWSSERSAAWEALRPRLVAEVQYDQVTGRRFRHGTRFLRWRPDKTPKQCTFEQLRQEARPSRLLASLLGY